MAYTKFGEIVRIIRIKNHEVMADMADRLGVRIPFLSAIETGKKNIPSDLIRKIVSVYGLNATEAQELFDAAEESKTQYKISAIGAGRVQHQAAMQFARSFNNMDDETAIKILELLGAGKGGD